MITELFLQNFRNLNTNLLLKSSKNIIFAQNGQGKSNILDAIYYLSRAKSFRKYAEGTNINWNTEFNFSRIYLFLEDKTKLEIIFSQNGDKSQNKYLVNSAGKTKNSFTSNLGTILFAPENLDIISGNPENRRTELDDFLTLVSTNYAQILKSYVSVVKNRNKLLQEIRENKSDSKQLDFWNEKLVELGSIIISSRIKVINDFLPTLKKFAFKSLKGSLKELDILYLSKLADLKSNEKQIKASFYKKVTEGKSKEVLAGYSLYGPHRDDFELLYKKRPVRVYASRGQKRIGALILKLAMQKYYAEKVKLPVVLLLDDVMSELDNKNSLAVEELLNDIDIQIIITSTHKEHFSEKFLKSANILELGI